ncbi:hypothetical protein [Anabaena sp. CCY 9910]|uniref:hypothetical protein n=1 Tax=Anabaena sp. CCY 9910 TaxID=3103870 RepID=UPI0039DFCEBA
MKARIIAVLAIALSTASLESPVRAQTPATPNPSTQDYKLTGDSLEGIGNRSAQDDFSQFFNTSIPTNNIKDNQNVSGWRSNRSTSLDTPVLLQPAQESVNGNDGVQVQLDLGNQ